MYTRSHEGATALKLILTITKSHSSLFEENEHTITCRLLATFASS